MSNCPKCNAKIKPTYLKQNCPYCGVNMLYYKLDEQLENDAKKANDEVEAVNRFVGMLKSSTIGSPWHIVRLVTFFLPLATMCLPMYWAGHKNVSLITFVMSIINHGFDLSAWSTDYLVAVLSMVLVIVLSLVVIIVSLFSSTKAGFKRNMVFSGINTFVLACLGIFCVNNGGVAKIGFYFTLTIYALELILHFIVAQPKTYKKKATLAVALVFCIIAAATTVTTFNGEKGIEPVRHRVAQYTFEQNFDSDIYVVSFNVASAFGTSLEDTDSMDRCQRFVDYMDAVNPSVIGTQEMNSYWLDYIDENMTGYTTYGAKRGGDSEEKNSEMNAIMWKADMFDEVEKDTFWLSETPGEESKYTYTDEDGNPAEAGCNRICTYAVLDDGEHLLLFMNTHLDNASEQARTFGVSVILDKMAELKAKYGDDIRVVLTGDFNEYASDEACQNIMAVLNDSTYEQVKKATYQEWGYQSTGDEPIDFIFTSGKSDEYRVLDNLDLGYVSDHYGIYSSITF